MRDGELTNSREMRLILARILFDFDIELADKKEAQGGGRDWLKVCVIYGFWKYPELLVKLIPAKRD